MFSEASTMGGRVQRWGGGRKPGSLMIWLSCWFHQLQSVPCLWGFLSLSQAFFSYIRNIILNWVYRHSQKLIQPSLFLVVKAFKQVISSQLWKQNVCYSGMDLLLPRTSMREKTLFTGIVNIKGKQPSIPNDFLKYYFGLKSCLKCMFNWA